MRIDTPVMDESVPCIAHMRRGIWVIPRYLARY